MLLLGTLLVVVVLLTRRGSGQSGRGRCVVAGSGSSCGRRWT